MSPTGQTDSAQMQPLTWQQYFTNAAAKGEVQSTRETFFRDLAGSGTPPEHDTLNIRPQAEALTIAPPEGVFEPTARQAIRGSDWLLAPLLLSLVLITLSRALYPRRFRHIFTSLLSSNNMNILLREGFTLGEPISVLLFGNFILVMGMFFLQVPDYFPQVQYPSLPPFLLFPLLVILVLLFVFLKVAGIAISGNIFRTAEESSAYLLNMFLFNQVVGVTIWPLMVITVYLGLKGVFLLAAGLLVLLYLIRGGKGLLIGLGRSRFSPMLFLFYLCTLEIIPLLLVMKLALKFT